MLLICLCLSWFSPYTFDNIAYLMESTNDKDQWVILPCNSSLCYCKKPRSTQPPEDQELVHLLKYLNFHSRRHYRNPRKSVIARVSPILNYLGRIPLRKSIIEWKSRMLTVEHVYGALRRSLRQAIKHWRKGRMAQLTGIMKKWEMNNFKLAKVKNLQTPT